MKLGSVPIECLVLLVKSYDIPSLFYNCHSYETQYLLEHIDPPPIPTVYQLIPWPYFVYVCCIADLLTSILLRSPSYLLYSAFLPADVVSVENLLLSLMKSGICPSLCSMLLVNLSVFYLPCMNMHEIHMASYLLPAYLSSYRQSHRISLSIGWFLHMNMFEQYSRYFYDVLFLLMMYLSSVVPRNQVLELVLLFKPSNYKSYLFHVLDSQCFHYYATLCIIESHVQYLLRTGDAGNVNFCSWIIAVFIILFISERGWKLYARERPKL
jgi:hypothetical protein